MEINSTIIMNVELGNLLKNFRTSYNKSANDVISKIDRSQSYLSKLETGSAVKKIDFSLLSSLCNAISDNNDGIKIFIQFAYDNAPKDGYSFETTLTLRNIDDVYYKFPVPKSVISYINCTLERYNISLKELEEELNANSELESIPSEELKLIPFNKYVDVNAGTDNKHHIVIKLKYSIEELKALLNDSTENATPINNVSIEAIFFTLYKLRGPNNEDAHIKAIKKMEDMGISGIRKKVKKITIDSSDENDIVQKLGILEPETNKYYEQFTKLLKIYLLISQDKGGTNQIQQLCENLKSSNIGFTFAFMSMNLSPLSNLSHRTKKKFLSDVKSLIKEYSEKSETDIDLFLD